MHGAQGGVSLHPRIGFSLAFASRMFLSEDLKKKRLAERLMPSKLLIDIMKNCRTGGVPGARAALAAVASWLICEAETYLTDFRASQ